MKLFRNLKFVIANGVKQSFFETASYLAVTKKILQFSFILLVLITGVACGSGEKNKSEMTDMDMNDGDYYTCSMHPTVKSKEPGNCPICKMKLIKVIADKKQLASNELIIDENKQLLAGISTSLASIIELTSSITATGKAVTNENNITSITSKINGRIEKLYFRNPNEMLRQGQALYELYSEELLADENDFLLSLEQEGKNLANKETFRTIIQASKNKLVLWGLTETQIKELSERKKVSPRITIYSTVSGIVSDIRVKEGEYVSEGTTLFTIINLSTIWVEAQFYSDELKYLYKRNQSLIEFEALPNEVYKGEVAFDNPTIEENTKVNLVRFKVENPSDKIKPGMLAYINLPKEKKKTLAIPKSALLPGPMTTVWIKTDKNVFESRMVKTGIEDTRNVEVLSGIKEGEEVVTTGAYLINSEYIFKKGIDPMAGMKM